nr:PREDICTED: LOW QUALITY PROTEIN: NADH dehydrogenase [ubiquinone] 1 beta subcomplex subunit 1 [Odobenus rosmarus divergens]
MASSLSPSFTLYPTSNLLCLAASWSLNPRPRKTPSEAAKNTATTRAKGAKAGVGVTPPAPKLKGHRETAKRGKENTGVNLQEESNIKKKKRYGFPAPPLSSSERGEWQVPRPQLPPAPVVVVAALGRGVVFGIKAAALRMNVIQIVRDHWVHILVPMGFVLGCYLDRKNDEKLTAFRNKSLLFKRELRPNEEVTWK